MGWLCDVGVAGGGNGLRSEGRGQRNFSGGEEGGRVVGVVVATQGRRKEGGNGEYVLSHIFLRFPLWEKNMPFPSFTKESSFFAQSWIQMGRHSSYTNI